MVNFNLKYVYWPKQSFFWVPNDSIMNKTTLIFVPKYYTLNVGWWHNYYYIFTCMVCRICTLINALSSEIIK